MRRLTLFANCAIWSLHGSDEEAVSQSDNDRHPYARDYIAPRAETAFSLSRTTAVSSLPVETATARSIQELQGRGGEDITVLLRPSLHTCTIYLTGPMHHEKASCDLRLHALSQARSE